MKPKARFFPSNAVNPSYGLEHVLAMLAFSDALDAETYVVPRNGAICRGVKQVYFEFDGENTIPATTQRQVAIVLAIKEFLCYWRGFTHIDQFHSMGVHTWDKDANENQSWLNNPHRKGDGDIGIVYGAHVRNLISRTGERRDQIKHVVEKLRNKDYDRRLVINWFDPFCPSAIPTCMYEHVFTVHDGYLNLSSSSRSMDSSLGGTWNLVQAYFLLHLMAALTGYNVGNLVLTVHDFHIYENQIDGIKEYVHNEPKPATAILTMGARITPELSLDELDTMPVEEIFSVSGYQSHGKYSVPLTV